MVFKGWRNDYLEVWSNFMEEDEAPGVPEWVVTYGDMMSLLLTFFIMLVSLSEVVADQKYRAVLDSLQQYTGYRGSPKAPAGTSFPLNSMIESVKKTLGSHMDDDKGFGGIKKKSMEGKDSQVFRTREGKALRIEIPLFFQPNTAEFSEQQQGKLKTIAQQLAGKPNKIEIRGHVSVAPLPEGSPWQNKTELSYHRARKIYKALIELKVNANRLRIGAAADREAKTSTESQKSDNYDRVDILILDAFTDDFIVPRNSQN